jgi:enoyl-CoA hydratase/carnithine racemase/CRP-like cAMP-binding protein
MTAQLLSTSEGQTLVLTLSNPEFRNALGPEMYAAGVEALSVAESSADVRSVVITGANGIFSAGGNLQRLQNNRQLPPEHQAQSIEGLHNWIEAIRTFPKPVIAAVEGPAAGAGFSLALACDMIVAARNSVFVMAYSSIALSPDGGGSWSLSRAVPRQLATELLMCGERSGAERLQQLGVVNRLADAGQALLQALELCEQLNARAPNALASIKELLSDADGSSLNAQLARERNAFVKNLHHPNAGIGIGAFLNKQKPNHQSLKGQSMDEPILTMEEREAINSGRWFSSLSPSLRHDILRCAYVKRHKDGDMLAARGDPPEQWIACAKGAVRVSSTSVSGKQITLTYVEPGIWFGDVSIFDGDRRTHDCYAHGETTTLNVAKADFKKILTQHVEFYDAMLRLHARRIRQLYGLVEDLNTLPLRARLAKQLNHLLRSYGVPSLSDAKAIRISLQLAQEELAQLLGASRQRVNQELKQMEREQIIRIEPGGLVVLDRDALLLIVNADH